MEQKAHIFRAGTHKGLSGKALTVTRENLEQLAVDYNSRNTGMDVPLVIGHPKLDEPAHGWVSKLEVKGDDLIGHFKNVSEGMRNLVKNRNYKKISCAVMRPEFNNGKLGLQHVGLFGARAVAVKGMPDAEFFTNNESAETFEFAVETFADNNIETFAEVHEQPLAMIMRRIRDWIISDNGLKKADEILPDYLVSSVINHHPYHHRETFSEKTEKEAVMTDQKIPNDYEKLAKERADLKKREDVFAEEQAQFAQSQAQKQLEIIKSKIAGQANLNPASKKLAETFAENLFNPIENFAEAETKYDDFASFVENFSQSVGAGIADTEERAASTAEPDAVGGLNEKVAQFAAEDKAKGVEIDAVEIVARAKKSNGSKIMLPLQNETVKTFIAATIIYPYRPVTIKTGTDNEIVAVSSATGFNKIIGVALPTNGEPFAPGASVDVMLEGISQCEVGTEGVIASKNIDADADGKVHTSNVSSTATFIGVSFRTASTGNRVDCYINPTQVKGDTP